MATEKLFTIAGISKLPSTHGGDYKMRFANDEMRVKVLVKGGHEDIRLVTLDQPMTKMEAAQHVKDMPEFSDAIAQATILEFIDENTPKASRVKAVKAVKVKPESTPTATKAPKAEKIDMKELEKAVGLAPYMEKDLEDQAF